MNGLFKKKSILVLLVIFAVAAATFGSVSLAQEIRGYREVQSHIVAAERYLSELDYERAIAEYMEALKIEPNQQEVLDNLQNIYQEYARYSLAVGEYEKAVQILEEATDRFDNQELQELMVEAEKQVKVVELLTTAQSCQEKGEYEDGLVIYDELLELNEQTESILDSLKGCLGEYIDKLMSEENFESVEEIIERYKSGAAADKLEEFLRVVEKQLEVAKLLTSAEEHWGNREYDESLEIYDKLLELDGQNSQILERLETHFEEYVNLLIQEKNYQKVRNLINKYMEVLPDIDFQSILSQVEAGEKRQAEDLAFMQKVFDLMAVEDWNALCELDNSEETETFLSRMESDNHVYIAQEEMKVGAGIYLYGEGAHYFYYGEYESGIRKGNGITFALIGNDDYELFTGEWKEDAPNGQGNIQHVGEDSFEEKGNLVNGLFEGEVDIQVISKKKTYDLSIETSQGRPLVDKTEEMYQKCALSDLVSGDEYICAYSKKGGKVVYSTAEKISELGVAGFRSIIGDILFKVADLPQEKSATNTAESLLNSAPLSPVGSGNEVLDALIQEIFSQILTDNMSTYEKVKSCYDWLIVNTVYGYTYFLQAWAEVGGDSTIAGAYEVLKYHEGVCDDYSAAFMFMTRAIGLDSYLEQGMTHKADGGYTPHAWVIIVINGETYVFDPQVEDNIAKGGAIRYYRFCKKYAEVPDKYIVN